MAKNNKNGPRPKYKKNKKQRSALDCAVQNQSAATNIAAAKPAESAGQLAEQKRAQYALQAVEHGIQASQNEAEYKHSELKAYIRRLPGMIQMNGFGQALAFFYAKRQSSKAYGAVYQIVENWLCKEGQVYADTSGSEHRLLTAITSQDQNSYRQAQAETQALMLWVKKFAEALILKEPETHND
ncbi:MAG: type III-B CRISPR module-associated protein Cmr5 [Amphritea sp.]